MSSTEAPDDRLHVDQRAEGSAVVVHAVGDVDMATAPILTQQLAHAAEVVTPPALIVADLREIQFFGSSGISVLIVAHQRCHNRGVVLRLVVGPVIMQRITIFGMQDLLTISATFAEALDTRVEALDGNVQSI